MINQSSSAFNHILSDVSLVVYQVSQCLHIRWAHAGCMHYVYAVRCLQWSQNVCTRSAHSAGLHPQIEALAGFSAIIDRLGEFSEVVDSFASSDRSDPSGTLQNGGSAPERIEVIDVPSASQRSGPSQPLLSLERVTLQVPDGSRTLVHSLNVEVQLSLTCLQGWKRLVRGLSRHCQSCGYHQDVPIVECIQETTQGDIFSTFRGCPQAAVGCLPIAVGLEASAGSLGCCAGAGAARGVGC